MFRFRLRPVLLIGAVCAIAISLVVTGPVPEVRPSAEARTADLAPPLPRALGREQVTCGYVGTHNGDMLVRPGVPTVTHDHDYFGAYGVTAATTVHTVRGRGTACPREDESTYWAPSLYIDGSTFRPTAAHVYYERNTEQPVTEFPAGFHMTVGDMSIRSESADNPHISFGCAHSTIKRTSRVTFTTCSDNLEPDSKIRNTFAIWLEFPNCWDGRPARGKYMSLTYATGADARCPTDHPTLLPTLRTVLWYDLPLGQTLQGIGIASGRMGSAHAVFVNGWEPEAMTRMVTCINTDNRECATAEPRAAVKLRTGPRLDTGPAQPSSGHRHH